MRFFYPDTPDLPLPDGHPFPAAKYRLLKARVADEGLVAPGRLVPSPLATDGELASAHASDYVSAASSGALPRDAQRRIGIPWSEVLVARARATVGGTLAAARAALADGIAGQLAGGTHHAHRDFGSGYCVFNDCAVTVLTLIAERRVARAAVLDLDVHHGDGTAALLGANPFVFTASVHGAQNFPAVKPPSTLDIGLPDGAADGAFLDAVETALDAVMAFRPEIVLYIAGVDPLAEDRLGRLAVSMDGLARRDRRVISRCRAAAVPLVTLAGGGYAEPIALTVEAYAQTVRIAGEVWGG
jgi:acetoin utilization deacetylase AcuC-like enzyme